MARAARERHLLGESGGRKRLNNCASNVVQNFLGRPKPDRRGVSDQKPVLSDTARPCPGRAPACVAGNQVHMRGMHPMPASGGMTLTRNVQAAADPTPPSSAR